MTPGRAGRDRHWSNARAKLYRSPRSPAPVPGQERIPSGPRLPWFSVPGKRRRPNELVLHHAFLTDRTARSRQSKGGRSAPGSVYHSVLYKGMRQRTIQNASQRMTNLPKDPRPSQINGLTPRGPRHLGIVQPASGSLDGATHPALLWERRLKFLGGRHSVFRTGSGEGCGVGCRAQIGGGPDGL